MYRVHGGILSCAGSGLKNRVARMSPAAWYQPGVGQTVTGAGVSTWADQSGNGRDLLQGTDTNRPALQADGSVLFDGADNFMVATFTLPKPVTIYDVLSQTAWTLNHRISDGVTLNSLSLLQNDTTPKLNVFDGGFGTATDGLAVAAKGIVCHSANGAASLIQINAGTPSTFTLGTTAMAGITVGTQGDLNTGVCGAFQIWERIVFTAAHSAAERSVVRNYLAARHGIAL